MFMRVSKGKYNYMNPSETLISVQYSAGGFTGSMTLDYDRNEDVLNFHESAESLLEVCERWLKRIWISSHIDEVKSLKAWLEDSDNAFAFDREVGLREIESLKTSIAEKSERLEFLKLVYDGSGLTL